MYKKITMLTSLDIKKLQSVFATKEDLKRFATKEDLNRFATKDDLKELESRFESKFATKVEMTAGFDAVMYELKAIREELTVSSYRRSENSKKIVDHENRIAFVEEKLVF